MTRVLVIAASSFIGRHVCDSLTRRKMQVYRTRRSPNDDSYLACDLTDIDSIAAALNISQPEWIIQCGAATSSRDLRELYQTHVFGTANFLEAIEQHAPTARVLLMGSAAEYGSLPLEWLPLTEDRLPRPSSVFGSSKLAQSELAQAMAAEKKLRLVSIRPFNVIGPGLPEIYFAASLSKRLRAMLSDPTSPREFEVTNANATRDFVDARDVAEACVALLERARFEPGTCDIFNIATSRETTLLEMATRLGELAGSLQPRVGGEHQSRGGISRSAGSFEKLQRTTGWQPQIHWSASLNDLWNEFASRNDR